eukprot:TRINITY_DN5910_c0_g1_i1.p1 TRINITY_DN5910_c0_g1~~TRINITY_DN5910_c0_g1_i1.p1  ORF type:complete len:217 (-),score=19.00 TRINITY_DN5910_c0_g1_i1:336-986(-)
MANNALYNPVKLQVRQQYPNVWHTDLLGATGADCPWCCLAVIGAPCVSYHLRSRTLYHDLSRYQCCGGFMPCSGHCGEQKCPEFCLCLEVFLCFGSSVATTRFLLQDQFNIQTTQCDNCIIGFMFVLQQVACVCSLIACITGNDALGDLSQALNCLADIAWCSVCACMQAQHKVQLDKRDGKFGDPPVMAPPAPQFMMRMDQPATGYPAASYPQQR